MSLTFALGRSGQDGASKGARMGTSQRMDDSRSLLKGMVCWERDSGSRTPGFAVHGQKLVPESLCYIRPVRYEGFKLRPRFTEGLPNAPPAVRRGIHAIKTLSRVRIPFKPKDLFGVMTPEELEDTKQKLHKYELTKKRAKEAEVEMQTARMIQSSRATDMFFLGFHAMPVVGGE
jgi:hypothetical protein